MRFYVGVDHHKKFSYFSVMNERGVVVKEGRIGNSKESVENFLGEEYSQGASAVLEAGRVIVVVPGQPFVKALSGNIKVAAAQRCVVVMAAVVLKPLLTLLSLRS